MLKVPTPWMGGAECVGRKGRYKKRKNIVCWQEINTEALPPLESPGPGEAQGNCKDHRSFKADVLASALIIVLKHAVRL